jgi:predicted amidophosphoribosyltransferase
MTQTTCIACGADSSLYKPFCEDCARFFVGEIGQMPFCVLCHEGYPLEHGMHKTKTGGHAGRCAVNQGAKPRD